MRLIIWLGALLGAVAVASTPLLDGKGRFSVGRPGSVKDIILTKENTLNNTKTKGNGRGEKFNFQAVGGNLPLRFVNNFDGGSIYAYINGFDSDGIAVFVGANGQLIYPTANGSTVPVRINESIGIAVPANDRTFSITIPITMTSGRIYFCEGHLPFFVVSTDHGDSIVQPSITNLRDPSSNLNWGFVEFTYTKEKAVYANISYVDFVGMTLSLALSVTDGTGTQITKGLRTDAVESICKGLMDQTIRDGWPWSRMCVSDSNGRPLRVLSPNSYIRINTSEFQNYWQFYVDQVWDHYTSEPLVINTQASAGNVSCQVSGGHLRCDGDNRPYGKPTAVDIWGCNSGSFGKQDSDNAVHLAVIPRLCAAFTRSTFLLQGGDIQPSLSASSYYTVEPTNYYSCKVHLNEVDGKGYAFSYDDINPENENASGLVSSRNPDALVIYVGGYL